MATHFLDQFATATQALVDPADVMETTARMLAEYLDVDRCAYAEVVEERVFVITGDHSRNGASSIVGNWDVAAFGPACVDSMRMGQPYVVEDSETDRRIGEADRPAYRATAIRAVICVPLHKRGIFSAAMAVHQMTPRQWRPDEIELVSLVVGRCWEALERSRALRDLRESEQRYRTMVETTPECVKLISRDGAILQMNPAGMRMFEIDESAIGTSIYELIAPEFRDRFRRFNERVCRGEEGTLEFDIIGRSGTRWSLETTAAPLPGSDGFRQLGITRDVTARVAVAKRLDYAVRLSGVGFWYCDLPFGVLQWDTRVKDHFFLPLDARVTIEIFYERIHPDDRERTRSAIDASIEQRTSYDVVYRTVHPTTGDLKYIRALGGTTYGDDGTPTRFDGVTVDVTDQRREAERLAGLYDQLRDEERRKDEFLATLAHELRNPLAPIRTGIELLQMGAASERVNVIGTISRQLGHMVRMVDDLLDISRIKLGKVSLNRELVSLSAVLESAIETARPLLEARGHELDVRLPDASVLVAADPTRLGQVFANLLNNAAKFTPVGGRISIDAEIRDEEVVVRVVDTGVGIQGDMLLRVFEMFTQLDRVTEHAHGGLGIGLTLVRGLVEMHGGTVEATSGGPGAGTTFSVRLPRGATAPQPAQLTSRTAMRTSGLRILVVDDNVDAADMLALLLEAQGNETRASHTGEAALADVLEYSPDLVFLDIGLPELSGYEVAMRIRSNDQIRQPVLVALTGWGSDADRSRAYAAGFDQHLVKPIDIAKLSSVLDSLANTSASSRR
ncbi:hypothetical protein BH11MYX2_BH11MYX2_21610 [soil metagenome]